MYLFAMCRVDELTRLVEEEVVADTTSNQPWKHFLEALHATQEEAEKVGQTLGLYLTGIVCCIAYCGIRIQDNYYIHYFIHMISLK